MRLKDEIRRIAPTPGLDITPEYVYELLQAPSGEVRWYHWVWPHVSIPKVSFICWMAILERLYTMDRVARFTGQVDATCCFSQRGAETHEHLFFQCAYAKELLIRIMTVVDYDATLYDL